MCANIANVLNVIMPLFVSNVNMLNEIMHVLLS